MYRAALHGMVVNKQIIFDFHRLCTSIQTVTMTKILH